MSSFQLRAWDATRRSAAEICADLVEPFEQVAYVVEDEFCTLEALSVESAAQNSRDRKGCPVGRENVVGRVADDDRFLRLRPETLER